MLEIAGGIVLAVSVLAFWRGIVAALAIAACLIPVAMIALLVIVK